MNWYFCWKYSDKQIENDSCKSSMICLKFKIEKWQSSSLIPKLWAQCYGNNSSNSHHSIMNTMSSTQYIYFNDSIFPGNHRTLWGFKKLMKWLFHSMLDKCSTSCGGAQSPWTESVHTFQVMWCILKPRRLCQNLYIIKWRSADCV